MNGFPERAVRRCIKEMESGSVSLRSVRDVTKYRVDVSPFEKFLTSENSMVRRLALKIVAARGSVQSVIDAAIVETDMSILVDIFFQIGERKSEYGLEELCFFLESKDDLVRESAIDMFRRVGQESLLFSLVFDNSDAVVNRVKSYILQEEKREIGRKSASV